ncbi:zincin-like metallopeptidase domain-containing protein [Acidithiobacillus sp. M4-SHS-6]|uniref:zincin-like metallopeptidase domain-containing protein n=1 Tax=Acidithiobacillus sp. M4-SHS-6 TaxID=3383024 RepID=UPI0039BE6C11
MPDPALPRSGNNTEKKDPRLELADRLIEQIEAGTASWQRPWEAGDVLAPVNAVTGKRYNGVNYQNLMTFSPDPSDPRWCTYKQAQEQGWQVRKGAHGIPIEKWSRYEHHRTEEEMGRLREQGTTDPEPTEMRLGVRYYTVFHASQVDGIPPIGRPERNHEIEGKPDDRLPRLAEVMGVSVGHGGNRAFYRPSEDHVQMPPLETFQAGTGYDTTLLHELSHSTGHPNRLNRDLTGRFGSQKYAVEELRAEMSAAMTAASLGIGFDPASQDLEEGREAGNSAAYLASWLRTLPEKDRKQILMQTIKDAQGISDYLIERTPELRAERGPAVQRGDYIRYKDELGNDVEGVVLNVAESGEKARVRGIYRWENGTPAFFSGDDIPYRKIPPLEQHLPGAVIPEKVDGIDPASLRYQQTMGMDNKRRIDENLALLDVERARGEYPKLIGLREIPEAVRPFLGDAQLAVTNELLQDSADKAFYSDTMQRLETIIQQMPETYETDGKPDQEKPVSLRYFGPGNSQWFIIEKDKGDPANHDMSQKQAFGLADLGQGEPELGYINIEEITRHGAELDYHFERTNLLEIKQQHYPEMVRNIAMGESLKEPLDSELIAHLESRAAIRHGEVRLSTALGKSAPQEAEWPGGLPTGLSDDTVANAEAFTRTVAMRDPEKAVRWGQDLLQHSDRYSDAVPDFSPERLASFAKEMARAAERARNPEVGDLVRAEPKVPSRLREPFAGRVIAKLDTSGGDHRYHLRAEVGPYGGPKGLETMVYGRDYRFRPIPLQQAYGFDRDAPVFIQTDVAHGSSTVPEPRLVATLKVGQERYYVTVNEQGLGRLAVRLGNNKQVQPLEFTEGKYRNPDEPKERSCLRASAAFDDGVKRDVTLFSDLGHQNVLAVFAEQSPGQKRRPLAAAELLKPNKAAQEQGLPQGTVAYLKDKLGVDLNAQQKAKQGPEMVQNIAVEESAAQALREREAMSLREGMKGAWENLKGLRVNTGDKVVSGQEYVTLKVAGAQDRIASGKEGAATTYHLVNEQGEYSRVRDVRFTAFAKRVLAMDADGMVRNALEKAGIAPDALMPPEQAVAAPEPAQRLDTVPVSQSPDVSPGIAVRDPSAALAAAIKDRDGGWYNLSVQEKDDRLVGTLKRHGGQSGEYERVPLEFRPGALGGLQAEAQFPDGAPLLVSLSRSEPSETPHSKVDVRIFAKGRDLEGNDTLEQIHEHPGRLRANEALQKIPDHREGKVIGQALGVDPKMLNPLPPRQAYKAPARSPEKQQGVEI